jgi:hypothetical protein
MTPWPVEIDGIAGPVVVHTKAVGRPVVLAAGVPVPRLQGNAYLLPTDDGTESVPVLVRPGRGMSPYPRLVLGDEVYETGPAPPLWLQLLAIAPGLAVLLGGAAAFVAVLGIVVSWLLLRRPWSLAARAAAVGVDVVATLGLGWYVARVLGWS